MSEQFSREEKMENELKKILYDMECMRIPWGKSRWTRDWLIFLSCQEVRTQWKNVSTRREGVFGGGSLSGESRNIMDVKPWIPPSYANSEAIWHDIWSQYQVSTNVHSTEWDVNVETTSATHCRKTSNTWQWQSPILIEVIAKWRRPREMSGTRRVEWEADGFWVIKIPVQVDDDLR